MTSSDKQKLRESFPVDLPFKKGFKCFSERRKNHKEAIQIYILKRKSIRE